MRSDHWLIAGFLLNNFVAGASLTSLTKRSYGYGLECAGGETTSCESYCFCNGRELICNNPNLSCNTVCLCAQSCTGPKCNPDANENNRTDNAAKINEPRVERVIQRDYPENDLSRRRVPIIRTSNSTNITTVPDGQGGAAIDEIGLTIRMPSYMGYAIAFGIVAGGTSAVALAGALLYDRLKGYNSATSSVGPDNKAVTASQNSSATPDASAPAERDFTINIVSFNGYNGLSCFPDEKSHMQDLVNYIIKDFHTHGYSGASYRVYNNYINNGNTICGYLDACDSTSPGQCNYPQNS